MAVVRKPDWLQRSVEMTVAFADQTISMTSMSISDRHYHNCNIASNWINLKQGKEQKVNGTLLNGKRSLSSERSLGVVVGGVERGERDVHSLCVQKSTYQHVRIRQFAMYIKQEKKGRRAQCEQMTGNLLKSQLLWLRLFAFPS